MSELHSNGRKYRYIDRTVCTGHKGKCITLKHHYEVGIVYCNTLFSGLFLHSNNKMYFIQSYIKQGESVFLEDSIHKILIIIPLFFNLYFVL